jgi:hypothetical protein
VQRKEDNKVIDILEAGAMNKEIQQVTEMRFELANSAPINTLSLQQSVGFGEQPPLPKSYSRAKWLYQLT